MHLYRRCWPESRRANSAVVCVGQQQHRLGASLNRTRLESILVSAENLCSHGQKEADLDRPYPCCNLLCFWPSSDMKWSKLRPSAWQCPADQAPRTSDSSAPDCRCTSLSYRVHRMPSRACSPDKPRRLAPS
ncbi:hypothetical protein IQ07DRAFT_103868 [Pyrenochaeta sp. DS3sAY3a]|nr:hypothetical protein IQ07DRAFT_103868 [Pyrenochaeta sp. DS3sAY3a]